MRTLIAIVTARHRQDWRDVIRSTWLPKVPKDDADVLFFMGNGYPREFAEDEIALDCSDRYEHMPEKIRAIAKWATEHEYDFMLKCDDDVILNPCALLRSGYELRDYSGRANRPPQPYVVPMGFNYWLSKRSMAIVVKAPLPPDGSNDDEKWVAKHLWEHDIKLADDRRYFLHVWKFETQQPEVRRPLRAPKREKIVAPDAESQGFSWCIHLAAEQFEKIEEFKKVFNKYVKDVTQ